MSIEVVLIIGVKKKSTKVLETIVDKEITAHCSYQTKHGAMDMGNAKIYKINNVDMAIKMVDFWYGMNKMITMCVKKSYGYVGISHRDA